MRNKLKILGIGLILIFAGSCFYLQYSPERSAASFALVEKCRHIEDYLNLYRDVELQGIYTHTDSFGIRPEETHNTAAPSVAMEFLQISDVQLRDERAQLFSRFWSGLFDGIVDSVRFGQDQEKYDFAVLKCLLAGVNSYAKNAGEDKPAFLIHTGDSIHVSLLSEAWEFLYLMNQSLDALPWFNVIGNHDVTVFGTPVFGGNARLKNPGLSFIPVNLPPESGCFNAAGFIQLHKSGETVISGIPFRSPAGGIQDMNCHSPGAFDPDRTRYHGFDMIPSVLEEEGGSAGPREPSDLMGYYAFDYSFRKEERSADLPGKIRVVVLNTSQYVSGKAEGGVTEEQIEWLEEVLNGLPNEDMRAVVFGHHPLIPKTGWMPKSGIQRDRLKQVHELLRDHADVYFCGHAHRQGISDEYGFLQVIAPSILEFPQSGLRIRLAYGRDELTIEIIPFSYAEMTCREELSGNLASVVRIWEDDPAVLQSVERIVSLWEDNPHLEARDITSIAHLWENSTVVKTILDGVVEPFGQYEAVKRAVRKAALLKQGYLGRVSALEDAGEEDYFYLGKNHRLIIPLR